MSEYQYYEFLAIDRPLNPKDIQELRKLSTRAEITSTQFTNTYNWGDFRGSSSDMMEKYFDAHVYLANWGTRTLMLRLPRGIMDEDLLSAYCIDDPMSFWSTDKYTIISWCSDSESDGEWSEGEGWMSQLIQIRDELEKGDYRSLYIGWLLAISIGLPDEEAIEPAIPPGLDSPTNAQKSLIEFLQLDNDLVSAAAEASESLSIKTDQTENMSVWIDQLKNDEMKQMLLQVLSGEPKFVQSELRKRYNQFLKKLKTSDTEDVKNPRRTVKQLFELMEQARRKKKELEKLALQRKRATEERKRKEYLVELAKQFPTTWNKVEKFTEEKTGTAYAQAVVLLVDLSDAYDQARNAEEFKTRFSDFISKYKNRPALIRRIEEAGLKLPI
jgi:hypothetical protein